MQAKTMVRVRPVSINGEGRPALPWAARAAALAALLSAVTGKIRSQEAAPGPIARAESFLAGLRGLTARVAQRYHDRLHDREVEARATLALSRPSRLLVRFEDGRVFWLAGARVVAYEPEVGESGLVHERTLDDDDFAELRGLLAGTSPLRADFDVRELGPSASGDVIEVRPRGRLGWDRALVAIGPSGAPTRMLVVDEAGNTLRWVWSDVRTAETLPPETLWWTEPEGTPHILP
jgi:outer membrane lipoprotein-sorting protein